MEFLPLKDYLKSLSKRSVYRTFNETTELASGKIEEARSYLVKYYRNAVSDHSFVAEDGNTWDCMPMDNQPSLRRKKKKSIEQPPAIPSRAIIAPDDTVLSKQNNTGEDQFGNRINCPVGCVPVRRLTISDIHKHLSLDHYFKKRSLNNTVADDFRLREEGEHKYAYAKDLRINRGGAGSLNLWEPRLFNDAHVFSLSQIWISGGVGNNFQAVEAGWQVNPRRWGTTKPVLFIYWTADRYNSTGSYNLEQSNTFVQMDHNWSLGGALPTSILNGGQVELRLAWHFSGNAWWLYINNSPIGYYPSNIFRGGVLTKRADALVIGGEVEGYRSWPEMGSGHFAIEGLRRSAYARNIHLFTPDNTLVDANLTGVEPFPLCYTLEFSNIEGWDSNFFFGGPGGNNC